MGKKLEYVLHKEEAQFLHVKIFGLVIRVKNLETRLHAHQIDKN